MDARRTSRIARPLAFLAIAVFSAWGYLLSRKWTADDVARDEQRPIAQSAEALEPPSIRLDSTTSPDRTAVAAETIPDPGAAVSEPAKAPAVLFEVEVVDPDGSPVVEAPVSVWWPGDESTLAVMRTDEAGRATLRVEEDWVAHDETIHIGTPFVGSTPSHVACTLTTPPKERLRFVLEPAGSIEVVLVGGPTITFGERDECSLDIEDERCNPTLAAKLHERPGWLPLSTRSFLFPRVQPNLCFKAVALVRGLHFQSVSFEGPRRAGERVRVELPFIGADALVRGRLIDARGVPLVESPIVFRRPDRLDGAMVEGETDAVGDFLVHIRPSELPRRDEPIDIRADRAGERALVRRVNWPAQLDPLTSVEGPKIDIGTVALLPEALVASGRIVDESGAGAWGWVQMRVVHPEYRSSWMSDSRIYTSDSGEFHATSSLPFDRFELRGVTPDSTYSDPVEVQRGAQGLILLPRPVSGIRGRVLLGEGVDIDELHLRFECVEPRDSADHRISGYEFTSDGSFGVQSPLAGNYRVTVSLGSHELVAREAVVPQQGGIVKLEPIDLRDVVHAPKFVVVAAGSERLREGEVWIVEGEERLMGKALTREGDTVLMALSKVVDVVAYVPGFRVQRFNGVASGARLVLERGLPTNLRLEPAVQLPEGYSIHLRLDLHGEDALAQTAGSRIPMDADGRASFELPASGKYLTWIRLVSRADPYGAKIGVDEQSIERSANRVPEDIVVTLDEAALRKAIDEAQRK